MSTNIDKHFLNVLSHEWRDQTDCCSNCGLAASKCVAGSLRYSKSAVGRAAAAYLCSDVARAGEPQKMEAKDEYTKVGEVLTESEQRKRTPVYSGVMQYFPDALQSIARVSWKGNEKHNPGQPLHWSRGKSNDHADCVARHMLTPDEIDPESGETHLAHAAWRLLALLQLQQEARKQ
jgi:hypothetical protein